MVSPQVTPVNFQHVRCTHTHVGRLLRPALTPMILQNCASLVRTPPPFPQIRADKCHESESAAPSPFSATAVASSSSTTMACLDFFLEPPPWSPLPTPSSLCTLARLGAGSSVPSPVSALPSASVSPSFPPEPFSGPFPGTISPSSSADSMDPFLPEEAVAFSDCWCLDPSGEWSLSLS